jgi:dTDP-4-amino-4,6-dideoxygalactose transaminase
MIAINAPIMGALEEQLVLNVLRSGRLVKGSMVTLFEETVRRAAGAKHAIAVSSGTSALIASLLAHDIGPGDEVVTSPFTFVATLNAILYVGATPRFVDIGDDFGIDVDQVGELLGPRTRAVVPVHLYGCPVDMQALEAVLAGREIAVVEDAAQALGAKVGERRVGSFGTGCFSFYATKNVTTGEGGVVTAQDERIADAVRVLADQGQLGRYEYVRPGLNMRMTEMQAALGIAQMTRLDDVITRRREHAAVLDSGLCGIEGIALPERPPGRTHVFHQYTIRVTADARVDRDELQRHLAARGIATGVYYPRPVFDYDCFRHDARVEQPRLPRVERRSREVLSIPVHPGLTTDDLRRIVDAIREVTT